MPAMSVHPEMWVLKKTKIGWNFLDERKSCRNIADEDNFGRLFVTLTFFMMEIVNLTYPKHTSTFASFPPPCPLKRVTLEISIRLPRSRSNQITFLGKVCQANRCPPIMLQDQEQISNQSCQDRDKWEPGFPFSVADETQFWLSGSKCGVGIKNNLTLFSKSIDRFFLCVPWSSLTTFGCTCRSGIAINTPFKYIIWYFQCIFDYPALNLRSILVIDNELPISRLFCAGKRSLCWNYISLKLLLWLNMLIHMTGS